MPYEEIAVAGNAATQSNELNVIGNLDASRPFTVLHLGEGRSLSVPTEVLMSGFAAGGGLRQGIPGSGASGYAGSSQTGSGQSGLDQSGARYAGAAFTAAGSQAGSMEIPAGQEQVIPIVAEQAIIGKQTVATGTVRLRRHTETFTDTVSTELTRVGWEVERTPIGQLYEVRPEVRQEGEITVFPLVEERLVAKREYFLVEEVRVKRVATTTERSATIELQRDVLTVEREGA